MSLITVPFEPHPYQKQIVSNLKRFSVFVCHRRFGKTVLTVNLLTKWALNTKREAWRAGYIAPLYRQAEEIAWDYLKRYTAVVPGIAYNNSKLRADFPNGARITLLGSDNPDSLRGPYWDAVVFDEYAQIRPKVWPEIIRPALTDRKGWAIFIGTPQGHNHFYDLWSDAKANDAWAAMMYKASQTNILDSEELAAARKEMSPEQYEQEFECSFEAAIVGAYFGPLMQDATVDGRVTGVPHEPLLPVHTAWDLGVDDATAIWFFQLSPGGEIRWIDYMEDNNLGLDHYIKVLKDKPYTYGQHLAPHDIRVREFSTARSRVEFAASLGLRFDVVRPIPVADGIQAGRSLIPRSYFDEKKCDRGIQALKTYRKEYSDRLSTFRDSPLHDWASHGADAFRTAAGGLELIQSNVPTLKLKMPHFAHNAEHGWML
jgi:phage terminase large subunit